MLVIFSLPTSYAKNAVPAGNASKAEIEKYIKKNGTDNVSIDKLCKWYDTVGSDTSLISKVDTTLRNKTANQVKNYCGNKTQNYLEKNVPLTILGYWKELDTGTKVQKNRLTSAKRR